MAAKMNRPNIQNDNGRVDLASELFNYYSYEPAFSTIPMPEGDINFPSQAFSRPSEPPYPLSNASVHNTPNQFLVNEFYQGQQNTPTPLPIPTQDLDLQYKLLLMNDPNYWSSTPPVGTTGELPSAPLNIHSNGDMGCPHPASNSPVSVNVSSSPESKQNGSMSSPHSPLYGLDSRGPQAAVTSLNVSSPSALLAEEYGAQFETPNVGYTASQPSLDRELHLLHKERTQREQSRLDPNPSNMEDDKDLEAYKYLFSELQDRQTPLLQEIERQKRENLRRKEEERQNERLEVVLDDLLTELSRQQEKIHNFETELATLEKETHITHSSQFREASARSPPTSALGGHFSSSPASVPYPYFSPSFKVAAPPKSSQIAIVKQDSSHLITRGAHVQSK